jgi:hypothetical protein
MKNGNQNRRSELEVFDNKKTKPLTPEVLDNRKEKQLTPEN